MRLSQPGGTARRARDPAAGSAHLSNVWAAADDQRRSRPMAGVRGAAPPRIGSAVRSARWQLTTRISMRSRPPGRGHPTTRPMAPARGPGHQVDIDESGSEAPAPPSRASRPSPSPASPSIPEETERATGGRPMARSATPPQDRRDYAARSRSRDDDAAGRHADPAQMPIPPRAPSRAPSESSRTSQEERNRPPAAPSVEWI